MNSDISIREVFSPSRRKRPKLTGDSESDSDEDLTDCDSETAKKEVEELEEALLRKEAEIKDLNYELEKEREKYEEYVASTVEKEKTNKQTISKQQEEIIKLRKDNDDLKNLVEYLKEENKNLNEILSATALGSARSLDKHKNHTITDDSNNMIVPDDFTPVNVAIKKEPPDPVEIQDYLELGTENCKEESLLPVVGETPVSSVTDSELKVATEKSAGPSKISKVVDKVQNASARSSLSVPSASNCKPQDQSEEESSSQGNGHTELETYFCHHCCYSTKVKRNFESHSRLHSGMCDECDFTTPDQKEMTSHRIKAHFCNKRFKCDQCDEEYKKPADLARHLLMHMDERKWECDQCVFATKVGIALARHKTKHHGVERKYKCQKCVFATQHPLILEQHRHTHEGLECDQCDEKYQDPADFARHLLKHMAVPRHECDQCNFFTKFPSTLVEHKLKHASEVRTYKCEKCSYATAYLPNLEIHKRDHNVFKCKRCDFVTHHDYHLKDHQLQHIAEAVFKCNLCDATFKRKDVLMKHRLTHGDKTTLKCNQCNYSTTLEEDLNVHKRCHAVPEKPFKCDQCEHASTTINNLVAHKSRIHCNMKLQKIICKGNQHMKRKQQYRGYV